MLPGGRVREMLIATVEKRFQSAEAVLIARRRHFLGDNGNTYVAAETREVARSLGFKLIGVQSVKQRHDRELLQRVQVRLCDSDVPVRHAGAATGSLPAFQRGVSAFIVENALPCEVRQHQASLVRQAPFRGPA